MLADFFTKPLQGNLFREFRDVILGYKHTDNITTRVSSSREEGVGNSDLMGLHGEEKTLEKSFPLEDPKLFMGAWTVVNLESNILAMALQPHIKNSTKRTKNSK
jgi:hypothetical protein